MARRCFEINYQDGGHVIREVKSSFDEAIDTGPAYLRDILKKLHEEHIAHAVGDGKLLVEHGGHEDGTYALTAAFTPYQKPEAGGLDETRREGAVNDAVATADAAMLSSGVVAGDNTAGTKSNHTSVHVDQLLASSQRNNQTHVSRDMQTNTASSCTSNEHADDTLMTKPRSPVHMLVDEVEAAKAPIDIAPADKIERANMPSTPILIGLPAAQVLSAPENDNGVTTQSSVDNTDAKQPSDSMNQPNNDTAEESEDDIPRRNKRKLRLAHADNHLDVLDTDEGADTADDSRISPTPVRRSKRLRRAASSSPIVARITDDETEHVSIPPLRRSARETCLPGKYKCFVPIKGLPSLRSSLNLSRADFAITRRLLAHHMDLNNILSIDRDMLDTYLRKAWDRELNQAITCVIKTMRESGLTVPTTKVLLWRELGNRINESVVNGGDVTDIGEETCNDSDCSSCQESMLMSRRVR